MQAVSIIIYVKLKKNIQKTTLSKQTLRPHR